MLRCMEQNVCNISYMHLNQKVNFNDWCIKIDPPMWIAADFACMNIPINDDVADKLFVNKPVAIGYIRVENPDYEKLNLKKDGYIKFFAEDCVEWFLMEMLEIEGYMKNYFKNELEIIVDTLPRNFDQTTCWLCEKEFELKDLNEIPVVKDHCHLTCKFRGLAHINCTLNTRKAHTSIVPILFHNFSGYECHLIFEKLINKATEKKTLKK